MRDLRSTNPEFALPSRACVLFSALVIIMAATGAVLADGAAPELELTSQPICLFCFLLIILSLSTIVIPKLFDWGWNAQYFALISFQLASISLMAIVPLFCLLLYSRAPILIRIAIFFAFVISNYVWCRRFLRYYTSVMRDPFLSNSLYEHEGGSVYFMQERERLLVEEQRPFRTFPSNRIFLFSLICGCISIFFIAELVAFFGLPFTHIFLIVIGLPISMFGLGMATRGWIIYLSIPLKILRSTGAVVYVDMAGK